MRVVIQRVKEAQVKVENRVAGSISKGLLVFVGFHHQDDSKVVDYLTDKILHLRIFADEDDKMNNSLLDEKGSLLIVSQFTLYAELSGRRPSFTENAKQEKAKDLYRLFIDQVRQRVKDLSDGPISVQTGEFGAKMEVTLINDGPVTILLEK